MVVATQSGKLKGGRPDATPVLDQLIGKRKASRFDFGNQEGGSQGPTPPKLIQLRIHKVKCLDETGDWGDDEIALGGLMIDDLGKTINVAEFYASKSFSNRADQGVQPAPALRQLTATKNGQKKYFAVAASLMSGLLIGILVGAALTAIFALLASWFRDDIFEPVSAAFYVPSIESAIVTPPEVATYSGHGGRYQVTYGWAVIV